MTLRFFLREVAGLIRGQLFLFPKINFCLLRIYGSVEVFGRRQNISFGRRCKLFSGVKFRLSDSVKNDEIILSDNVSIESGCYLNAHGGNIFIGNRAFIGVNCVIQGKGTVSIGAWSMLGPLVSVFSSDHDFRNGYGPYRNRGEIASAIFIGENVWVGASSTVLRGVTIGDNSVIGAMSLIKSDISKNTLAKNSYSSQLINRKLEC